MKVCSSWNKYSFLTLAYDSKIKKVCWSWNKYSLLTYVYNSKINKKLVGHEINTHP